MEAEFVFKAREVDHEYEFDAAMFFDFTREESLMEARDAERWFEIAPNYPPSPFVTKLALREDILLENPISKDVEHGATLLRDDYCHGLSLGVPSLESEELTTYNHKYEGKSEAMVKKPAKSNLSRKSTLMKPTSSMLEKQNCARQIFSSRFQMLPSQKERTMCNPSVEIQAKEGEIGGWSLL